MNIWDLNSGVYTKGRLITYGIPQRHIGAAIHAGFLESFCPGSYRVNRARKMALIEEVRKELVPGQTVRIAKHGKVLDYQVVRDDNGKISLIDPDDPNGRMETRMHNEVDADEDDEEDREENKDLMVANEENIKDVVYHIYMSLHDTTGSAASRLYDRMNRIMRENGLTMADVLTYKKQQQGKDDSSPPSVRTSRIP